MGWFKRTPPPSAAPSTSTSLLEWSFAAIGGLILVGMIGFMVVQAVGRNEGPAEVELTAGTVESTSKGYVLTFTARNVGSTTAAALKVKALLLDGDRVVEERETTIDYLPAQSERGGGFFFTNDPLRHRTELTSDGYADP